MSILNKRDKLKSHHTLKENALMVTVGNTMPINQKISSCHTALAV